MSVHDGFSEKHLERARAMIKNREWFQPATIEALLHRLDAAETFREATMSSCLYVGGNHLTPAMIKADEEWHKIAKGESL